MDRNGDRRHIETPNKYVALCKCGATMSTNNHKKMLEWVGKHQGEKHFVEMVDI